MINDYDFYNPKRDVFTLDSRYKNVRESEKFSISPRNIYVYILSTCAKMIQHENEKLNATFIIK